MAQETSDISDGISYVFTSSDNSYEEKECAGNLHELDKSISDNSLTSNEY